MQYLARNSNAGTLSLAELTLPADLRETEDRPFLDVLVPKAVFDMRDSTKDLAPVTIWPYDTGLAFSFKGTDGDATTIIKSSQRSSQQSRGEGGVIYVVFNYCTRASGFLGWSNLQSNGSAHVRLLDQRLPSERVQKNIVILGRDL